MTDAFDKPHVHKARLRRRAELMRPTAGRTAREIMRIKRQCENFDENVRHLLEATEYKAMPWFDTRWAITDRDDNYIVEWRNVVESHGNDCYDVDQDGLLYNLQDDQIRASNRIEAVMVFEAERNDGTLDSYMLRKSLFSPILCPKWVRSPLPLSNWRILVMTYIESRARWQYENALNEYVESRDMPAGYKFSYIVGWNLSIAQKPSQQPRIEVDETPWTGPIIYSLATTGFLHLNTQDTSEE